MLNIMRFLSVAVCVTISVLAMEPNQQSFAEMPFSKYGLWGFGPCPKVTPMENFDVTRIYGGNWYLIAHYSEAVLLDRHCLVLDFNDGNSGNDRCRIVITNNSTEYDDGERKRMTYYRLQPNVAQEAVWIDTFLDVPIKSTVIDSDYNDYILWHECIQYPRDMPIFYEQHNYIHSRNAVWNDVDLRLQKAFKVYESFGIDASPFVLHDQENC